MPKFKGSSERSFTIRADIERVVQTMTDPQSFSGLVGDLETIERLGDDLWRWRLREISEKGVHFKADYTIQYARSGERFSWRTVGTGNMTSEGSATFTRQGSATRVDYTETIECDMDVNRLLAKVIKPIVDRQIARGVNGYLDRVKEHLEVTSR